MSGNAVILIDVGRLSKLVGWDRVGLITHMAYQAYSGELQ